MNCARICSGLLIALLFWLTPLISIEGAESVPVLTARETGVALYARQDPETDRIATLEKDEILVPIAESIGGQVWYMLLAGLSTARPATFELTAKLLDLAKMQIEKVAVTALCKNIYYASVWIKIRGKIHEVDARPSDAVILSLRAEAPIYVTPEVLEANPYLVNSSAIIPGLDDIQRRVLAENRTLPEEIEMEWRSFRSLPRGNGGWIKRADK